MDAELLMRYKHIISDFNNRNRYLEIAFPLAGLRSQL